MNTSNKWMAWQKAKVQELRRTLSNSSTENSFIQTYYQALHTQLLQATVPVVGNYNVGLLRSAITAMLAEIRAPTYLINLQHELITTCLSASPTASTEVRVLVQMLLVRLVELVSRETLQEHPAATISHAFLTLHETELDTGLHSENVQATLTTFVEALSSGLDAFVHAFDSGVEGTLQEKARTFAQRVLVSHPQIAARVGLFFIRQMFEDVALSPDAAQELISVSVQDEQSQHVWVEHACGTAFWRQVGDKWFGDFAREAILLLLREYVEASRPGSYPVLNPGTWIDTYRGQITGIQTAWQAYQDNVAESLIATHLTIFALL